MGLPPAGPAAAVVAGAVVDVDVAALAEGLPGRVAVYGRHLGTGEEVALDADRSVATGSAAKVLVLLAYAEQVAGSRLDPAARVPLTDADVVPGSGVLRFCRPGLEPALEDLAFLMMTVSDNVATDLLLRAVGGRAAVAALTGRLGLADAAVLEESCWVLPPRLFGAATPRALAGAYAVLADPEAAGYPVAAAERALAVLSRHQHLNGFARSLPFSPHAQDFGVVPTVRIWSKSGSFPTVQCEAGLFETDSARWVLAVMCDELTDLRAGAAGSASTLIAEVARALADAWGRPSEVARPSARP